MNLDFQRSIKEKWNFVKKSAKKLFNIICTIVLEKQKLEEINYNG